MNGIIDFANKNFQTHPRHGCSDHHVDRLDFIGSLVWSEILCLKVVLNLPSPLLVSVLSSVC